jgi:hypothetical protein
MKILESLLFPTAVLASVCSTSTNAIGLRCQNDIAQIGESKISVLQKCGEPMHKESFCKPLVQTAPGPSADNKGTTVIVMPCEKVEEWTYNPGSGQFYTTLRFERGELQSIRYGDRVP